MTSGHTEPISSEFTERVKIAIEKDLAPYVERMMENTQRVERLMIATSLIFKELSESSTQAERSNALLVVGDIFRSAIVLTHAYLEDFLRTLAATLLPEGDERSLNGIPLAGSGGGGRGEKFLLGHLVQHKGKSVEALVRESVSEYLDHCSFNSTGDIARILEAVGFNVSDHNQDFSAIDEMIQRRHQIVHRADRIKATDSDVYSLQPVDPTQVGKWTIATSNFMIGLAMPIVVKLNPPDKLQQKFGIPEAAAGEHPSRATPEKLS